MRSPVLRLGVGCVGMPSITNQEWAGFRHTVGGFLRIVWGLRNGVLKDILAWGFSQPHVIDRITCLAGCLSSESNRRGAPGMHASRRKKWRGVPASVCAGAARRWPLGEIDDAADGPARAAF